MTTTTQQTEQQHQTIETAISLQNVSISYGQNEAVRNVFVDPRGKVTALSDLQAAVNQLLRSLNRMNDLIDGCSLKGSVLFDGVDLYASKIDPVEVRRRIGMVFQQIPFKKYL